jgi:hypothetical protein
VAKYRYDIDDQTGDPWVDQEAMENGGHTHPRLADVRAAEAALRQRIDHGNLKAAEMGVYDGGPGWGPGNEEYMDPQPGLSDSLKNEVYQREMQTIIGTSRQEYDSFKKNHAIVTEALGNLWEDFIATYGEIAQDQASVANAAARVVGQWRADGTRNVERRISKDPDGFLDSVANECMFGDCSGGGAGETHRTLGSRLWRWWWQVERPGRRAQERHDGRAGAAPTQDGLLPIGRRWG